MKHNRAVHIQLLLYIKTREIESQIEEKTSTKGKTLSVIAMVHCASHNFTSSATTLSVLFGVGKSNTSRYYLRIYCEPLLFRSGSNC